MQEEIKEILKCLEMDMLDNKQIEILKDYITNLQEKYKEAVDKITNLQEENERLKQIIKTANMMEYFKGHDILQGSDKE